MKRIVIVGGGFAGYAAAAAAARNLDLHNIDPDQISITLINRDPYHSIRVRNYEADFSDVRVPLASALGPIDVEFVEAEVTGFDLPEQQALINAAGDQSVLSYDRLVFAAGSRLPIPDIPGLSEYCFDVDTTDAGDRLNEHFVRLGKGPAREGRGTAIVVGAGLTGVAVAAIDADGVELGGGERIAAATVIWTAGMQASPLADLLPVKQDALGRAAVDEFMRVNDLDHVFAAGDVAAAKIDGEHQSVMSCQHGRPMGHFAGHNAVADVLGENMLPLSIPHYVTCLNLGPWGALYTEGWDRRVTAKGAEVKKTKQIINCDRIYPPRNATRAEILAAAEPIVQTPPLKPPQKP